MNAKAVIWILGIVIVVLLGVLAFYPEKKISSLNKCKTDADCVFVDACCNCNNGGYRVAFNKDKFGEAENFLRKNCESVSCLTVISEHPSCEEGVYPKCLDETCIASNLDPSLNEISS